VGGRGLSQGRSTVGVVTDMLLVRHGQSEWNALGRWQGTADPALTELGRRQALHAASFGAVHLAAMHYLRDRTPLAHLASAQGFHAAIGGALLSGLLTPVGGWLYGRTGGQAFWAMALVALLGTVLALRLARRHAADPQ